jgi:hypothetical protein
MPLPVAAGLLEAFGYGAGYQDLVQPANPGAGLNLAIPVDARNWLRVLGAIATVNTSGVAGNRFVSLDFVTPKGVTYLRNAAGLVVTASAVNQVFSWSEQRTVAEWAANTPVLAPVSSVFLPPQTTVQITLDGIQAGDTITAVTVLVERFDTGPGGYPIGFVEPDPAAPPAA